MLCSKCAVLYGVYQTVPFFVYFTVVLRASKLNTREMFFRRSEADCLKAIGIKKEACYSTLFYLFLS